MYALNVYMAIDSRGKIVIKAIVHVDREWGIGYKGELLARVRADLKNFQALTKGNVVVYGSKTLMTFPGARPLKNRENIVMSRTMESAPDGASVVHSIEELLAEIQKYPSDSVFVIGGASVYEQLLPYCDTAIVTFFDKSYEKDAYLPNLDVMPEWERVYTGERQTSDAETDSEAGLEFYFTEYRRK